MRVKKLVSAILGLLIVLPLAFQFNAFTVQAAEAPAAVENNTDISVAGETAEVIDRDTAVYDPTQEVDIVINLEDESTRMGVTVYRIGDYDGHLFKYTEEIKALMPKDYYKLSREGDILSAAQEIAAMIGKKITIEGVDVSIYRGVGTAEDLTPGLYLVVQNKAESNATLDTPYIVEAPEWSEDTLEYMYDIRTYPKWEKAIWFTFRPAIVRVVVIASVFLFCVSLCLIGGKVLRIVSFGTMFVLCGYTGTVIANQIEQFESNFLMQFFIFLIFAFLGMGLIWIVLSILSVPVRALKLHKFFKKRLFWVAPVIGATGIGYILTTYMTVGLSRSIIIATVLGVLGCILQGLRKKREITFYTYDDLLRLKPGDEELI